MKRSGCCSYTRSLVTDGRASAVTFPSNPEYPSVCLFFHRSDNDVKNRWHCIKKRTAKQAKEGHPTADTGIAAHATPDPVPERQPSRPGMCVYHIFVCHKTACICIFVSQVVREGTTRSVVMCRVCVLVDPSSPIMSIVLLQSGYVLCTAPLSRSHRTPFAC